MFNSIDRIKSVLCEILLIKSTEVGRHYSIADETPAFIKNVNILDDNIPSISLKNRLIAQVNVISLMIVDITKNLINFSFTLIRNFIANITLDW